MLLRLTLLLLMVNSAAAQGIQDQLEGVTLGAKRPASAQAALRPLQVLAPLEDGSVTPLCTVLMD